MIPLYRIIYNNLTIKTNFDDECEETCALFPRTDSNFTVKYFVVMSKEEKNNEIKIDLNVKVSPEFSCALTKGIVDYLLYYRHQIPFNFELFEKLIKQKEETTCFRKLKLINLAKNTYESICQVKTVRKTRRL